MKSYLALSRKYLSAHKGKARLTILSVIMAVILVTGIFSLLDSLLVFEKKHVLETEGNYHLLVRNPTKYEIEKIGSRIDVKNAGSLKDLDAGRINGTECVFAAIDANIASDMNFDLSEGAYPEAVNEIMVENWFAQKSNPALMPGDAVTLILPDKAEGNFIISGLFKDWGATKALGIPGVFLSMKISEPLPVKSSQYFILFKDGVNILKVEESLKKALDIKGDRIGRNEGLLAVMGQSKNNKVLKFYAIGAILFCLVLVTAVVMIYNTFNISVTDRVRQFGILRCIGASGAQIRRLVRREGLFILLKAIPFGVVGGILMSAVCSALLKYYNNKIYGDISLVHFSTVGIGAGAIVGIFTVYLASLLPAKKASAVSPVSAIRGDNGEKARDGHRRKNGSLMKLFRAETAIGAGNALRKKKTLFLMSGSIALSSIMFLGFHVLTNPAILGAKPIRAYTPDLSLRSDTVIDPGIYNKLSALEGIERIYGRMSGKVDANFKISRLTDKYRKIAGAASRNDGMIASPEKSWLVSYDPAQIEWAEEDLTAGKFDEKDLNEKNGIIAVEKNWRENTLYQAISLKPGDKVSIRTPAGNRTFTVIGVVETIPYGTTDDPTLASFITTEKLFAEITGTTGYRNIDIQLEKSNQERTVNEVKKIIGHSVIIGDRRQFNEESNNAYLTVALFVYGFVAVIALISILNIFNTMNTSISAKTRYLGVMMAIGMSRSQLSVMVLAEAVLYSLCGCLTGCIAGVALHRALSLFMLERWSFPAVQVVLIFIACMLAAALSTIGPLKRIKKKGISETINMMV